MFPQHLATNYALHFLGKPGLWGGNDPLLGYDCSGFIQEVLMAFGVFKRTREKINAQKIFDIVPRWPATDQNPKPGDLVFYGLTPKSITHVGLCLDAEHMIHAGSVDSETTSLEKAAAKNAFVRIDRIDYRANLIGVVRPIYPGIVSAP